MSKHTYKVTIDGYRIVEARSMGQAEAIALESFRARLFEARKAEQPNALEAKLLADVEFAMANVLVERIELLDDAPVLRDE